MFISSVSYAANGLWNKEKEVMRAVVRLLQGENNLLENEEHTAENTGYSLSDLLPRDVIHPLLLMYIYSAYFNLYKLVSIR